MLERDLLAFQRRQRQKKEAAVHGSDETKPRKLYSVFTCSASEQVKTLPSRLHLTQVAQSCINQSAVIE
jgi:hypothetical protein